MIQSQHHKAMKQSNHALSRSRSSIPAATIQPSQPLAKLKGKDLFSSSIWMDSQSTSTFYTFIASLRKKIHDEVRQTAAAHRFLRTLRDSKRLVRCYTQNIDGLETREGLCADLDRGKGNRARFTKKAMTLPRGRANFLPGGNLDGGCEVVQLHGDLKVLRCDTCRKTCQWEGSSREALLLSGEAPKCESCQVQNQDRQDQGKRGTKIGSLRPNIVLYGEEHPSSDIIGTISTHDLALAPDVLLILGTSLHVHGFKVLVKEFAKSVHARPGAKGKVIFVNLTRPSESVWNNTIDYWVSMDCDKWIAALRCHRPDLWQIQDELEFQVKKSISKSGERFYGPQKVKVNVDSGKENMERSSNSSNIKPGRPTANKKGRLPFQSIINESSKTSNKTISNPVLNPTTPKSTRYLQLVTPPPSGNRLRSQDSSRKRSRSDAIELLDTPSKRKKPTSEIWKDRDANMKGKETKRQIRDATLGEMKA